MESLRVLIVDDEEGLRMGTCRALSNFSAPVREAGCDVTFVLSEAGSAELALEQISEQAPDILLLDHKLPGMSGMDLLDNLPDNAADTLTIMITAYASIETAVRATKEGAFDFLPKPFTPAELRYVVSKAAGRIVLARRAKALAAERKRMRFEFIRVLGHELKAPLGAVENYLQLMRRRTLGPELDSYKEAVERSQLRLEQMRRLIMDLLDLTRIESGERSRSVERLNLADELRQSVEILELQAQERGITITVKAPRQLFYLGDRTEFSMIFNNLVSNAIKYNKDHGEVLAVLETDADDEIIISVKDTGIGMSAAEQEKLFKEFCRIKNEKTRNILGSGLGLSILQRLVDLYGGTITVVSAPEQGSTFSVRLPRQSESFASDVYGE